MVRQVWIPGGTAGSRGAGNRSCIQIATGVTAIGQIGVGIYVLAQIGIGKYVWTPKTADPEAVEYFRLLLQKVSDFISAR
jgi:hypothetical protein